MGFSRQEQQAPGFGEQSSGPQSVPNRALLSEETLHIEFLGGKLSSPLLLTTNRTLACPTLTVELFTPAVAAIAIQGERATPAVPGRCLLRPVPPVARRKLPAVDEVAMPSSWSRTIGSTGQGTYPLMRILTTSRTLDPRLPTRKGTGLSRSPRTSGVK